MKKKTVIIAVVLIAIILAVFFAGKTNKQNENGSSVSIGEVIKPTESTTVQEDEKEDDEFKDPDEIVKVELPLNFIDQKYHDNLDKLVKDKGYKSAKLNKRKNTVEIEMRALSYDLYLVGQGISTMQAICETFESKDFPYVKNLGEYEDDFSFVTILVNGEEFKKSTNVDELFGYIANCCCYYLLQDKDSPDEFKIEIRGEKSGKLLAQRTFNKNDYIS